MDVLQCHNRLRIEFLTITQYDCPDLTALHQSLSKYLTAQDTRDTPTITKQKRTLVWLGNLLYLQPRSTIKHSSFQWVRKHILSDKQLNTRCCDLLASVDAHYSFPDQLRVVPIRQQPLDSSLGPSPVLDQFNLHHLEQTTWHAITEVNQGLDLLIVGWLTALELSIPKLFSSCCTEVISDCR